MVVIFWSIDIAMDIFRSDALCRRHNQYEQKIEIIGLDGGTDDHNVWNKKTKLSDSISFIKFVSNFSFLAKFRSFLESYPTISLADGPSSWA